MSTFVFIDLILRLLSRFDAAESDSALQQWSPSPTKSELSCAGDALLRLLFIHLLEAPQFCGFPALHWNSGRDSRFLPAASDYSQAEEALSWSFALSLHILTFMIIITSTVALRCQQDESWRVTSSAAKYCTSLSCVLSLLYKALVTPQEVVLFFMFESLLLHIF